MIEYRITEKFSEDPNFTGEWVILVNPLLCNLEHITFVYYEYKINNIVYTSKSDEFKKAVNKEHIWARLQGKKND